MYRSRIFHDHVDDRIPLHINSREHLQCSSCECFSHDGPMMTNRHTIRFDMYTIYPETCRLICIVTTIGICDRSSYIPRKRSIRFHVARLRFLVVLRKSRVHIWEY